MVEIIKGSRKMTIPSGAYETYASAGWELATEPRKGQEKPAAEKKKPEKAKAEPEPEVEEEIEEDVIYIDPEDLLEKPLEELDFEELKILAEYKGIDIKGMKSSKMLREAIKSKK